MGSFKKSQIYDPLDLEILDRVYEAAWARFEAVEPSRDKTQDEQRQKHFVSWHSLWLAVTRSTSIGFLKS